MEPDAEVYLTVDEVARKLRVAKMTVYRMIHSGDLGAVRVQRVFRISQKNYDEYMSTRQTREEF
jgi:excisionase family DNA binding protein